METVAFDTSTHSVLYCDETAIEALHKQPIRELVAGEKWPLGFRLHGANT